MSEALFDLAPVDRAGWTVVAARKRAAMRVVRPARIESGPAALPFAEHLPAPHPRRCGVCSAPWADQVGQPYDGETHTYVMARQWWVKIGRSKHPETRLKELRAVNRACYIITPPLMDRTEPIDLVAAITGDIEHELHTRFVDCHAGGEWFDPDAGMRDWLRRLGSWRG